MAENKRLLSPDELETIADKADYVDGIAALLQSNTYTAAYLASIDQDSKTASLVRAEVAREIIQIWEDFNNLSSSKFNAKYPDLAGVHNMTELMANLKSKYGIQ